MDNTKLSDLVKSAVKVNLNYSASLLTLSKDYIKAMSEALTNPTAAQPDIDDATPARIPLQIQGEFEGVELSVDPAKLDLEIGANELVRILASITSKAPVGKDMAGVVMIPELGLRVAEFVVRRLADQPAPVKKPATKKTVAK